MIFISVPKPLPVPSQVVLNCSPVFSRFYARAQRSNENKRKRGLCILVPRGCAPVSYHKESRPTFSSPEPTILLACGRNRDLWEQPFQACAVDADCVKFGYSHCYFKIVAPRALVFRSLIKGNEALGTRLRDPLKGQISEHAQSSRFQPLTQSRPQSLRYPCPAERENLTPAQFDRK